jgi:hypothetical protein
MVDQAKMRWRIERDYLELKQEGWIQVVVATRYFVGQSVDTGK